MDSAPTSRLRHLDAHGEALSAPREWEPGYVEVEAPLEEWQELTLSCNGQALDIYARELAGTARVVAEWPRSGTGHYRLELEHGNFREQTIATIWPRKISKSNYLQLLEDLEELPPSIAIALQQRGALSGVKLPDPNESTLASELQRLRVAIEGSPKRPGLTKVLRALALDPYLVLQRTELWLPRDRVRRVDPFRFAQAFAVGHNVNASGQPMRLPESRVEHTVDVYENRLVRVFHDQVNLRVRRLRRRLTGGQAAAISDELASLERSLSAARREASFLDHVTAPRQLPTQLTMVLLRRPAYRAALEGYLEFRRTVSIRLEEPALDAPLENLPTLYEAWGTLQVLKAASDVASKLGFTVSEHIFRRDTSGLYLHVLKNGRSALVMRHAPSSTTVKVIPQRTYGRGGTPLRSASYAQTPDIVLEITQPERAPRVLIFDPKYKLESEELADEISDGKPKKVDIDKMHAYRDAIRDGEDVRRVEYAAIIYPGASDEEFGAGLEALAARPGEDALVKARIRDVLAEALRTGVSPKPLRDSTMVRAGSGAVL